MAEQYLVLFDADKIKDYVFATGRLKEIRGASDQVRHLTDPQPIKDQYKQWFHGKKLADWHADMAGDADGLIYAGGGAGALLFADEHRASEFCMRLEQTFRQETRSATLSAVAVPVVYETGIERNQAEAAAQDRAARALARRKASRPWAEAIPSGGMIRFCASDRLRPASVVAPIQPDDPGDFLLVSEATAVKRRQSREARERATFLTNPFWQAFEPYLPAADRADWRSAVRGSQDLGSIGAQSRPRGYVALVYLDGDRIGALQRAVVSQYGFTGYALLSRALDYAAHTATATALALAYRSRPPVEQRTDDRKRRQRFLPFEIITIGGDDVILICTAEYGLAVACALSQEFSTHVKAYLQQQPDPLVLPQPVSASVGVVIAHDSMPIVQLERRGRDLLKQAKTVAQEGEGGVDFHIVSTAGLDAIKIIRKQDYQPDSETNLTRRPYRRTDAEQLLHAARHLRGFCAADGTPRSYHTDLRGTLLKLSGSKRADLYRACQNHRLQATFEVLTIHTRLPPREREALLQALTRLHSVRWYPFGAPDDDGVYTTVLLDLLEVMEFVAEEAVWIP